MEPRRDDAPMTASRDSSSGPVQAAGSGSAGSRRASDGQIEAAIDDTAHTTETLASDAIAQSPTVGDGPNLPPGRSDLGHKASRGVIQTLGGLWGKTAIQLLSTVVLARLLSPSDFGLLAAVTAIVGVADLVRDFGLTGAIIQAKKMSDTVWRSVLWLSVALGVTGTLVIAASAWLIAGIYQEEQLIVLTIAVAPTLLVNSLCMPLQARVQKEMRFGLMARIDVVSMLVGVVGSILAAFLGWGVWSLVVLQGGALLYRFVALWVAARPSFGRPRISREVIPLVTTGGSIFGVQLLNYFARNVDNVLIGAQLGAGVLGQYTRAYSLFLLPLQQLNGPLGRVALPVLSSLQDDGARYRRYVRGALLVIGYLTLPTFGVLSALSGPLVELLLGAQWSSSATILSLLSIAGIAQGIGNVQGWIYISLGRVHRQLVYYVVTRPLVIASFVVGLWWNGVEGLALLYGLTTLALLVPGFWLAIRGTFVRGSDVIVPVLRPALVVPFMYAAAWAVGGLGLPAILHLIVGGLASLVPLALAMALPAYRRDLQQILAFVKQVRKPRRPAGGAGTAGSTAPTRPATEGGAA
ncbi:MULTISPECIES: lipopolysaccharide biosynthesis protein [unclassified Rathayibacter]|uniref:lipopolysaccharide biosynthesis protein n=1 Tax=unclassified Rathayibacter TaxID=2609250 RepID=UPI001889ECE6|nr:MULTISPECIES: lipopolysaccharide biosynthesis protein [unclassified Rathayibacter]MBF4461276.1 lipopolysaccharide biosynthesis protein [Rathayibacter sp. VKM Ac-2879]MBF4502687.1 lipopolysaccharide biosynthesis protein [Rathayibacter sp. VKM Ac-2878]